MKNCLVSFGSNLGDSEKIITNALNELQRCLQSLEPSKLGFRVSEFVATRPIGGPKEQRVFVNGVVCFESSLDSRKILEVLHQVERSHGRERRIRWDARTLDLDLLIHGDTVLFEDDFQVPHPRMCFRQFVLQPAREVAPDLIHPVCSTSIQELLKCIVERESDIVLVTSPTRVGDMAKLVEKFSLASSIKTIDSKSLLAMMSEPPGHKLLAIDLGNESPQEFLRQQQNLVAWQKGPILLLKNQPGDKLMGELTAALEAMKAI